MTELKTQHRCCSTLSETSCIKDGKDSEVLKTYHCLILFCNPNWEKGYIISACLDKHNIIIQQGFIHGDSLQWVTTQVVIAY